MAYRKDVADARKDLDYCIGWAIGINRLAEELWVERRDVKLEAIARDAKEIQEAISRVNIRLFGQDRLFGTGEEEAVASRRQEFSPQGRE